MGLGETRDRDKDKRKGAGYTCKAVGQRLFNCSLVMQSFPVTTRKSTFSQSCIHKHGRQLTQLPTKDLWKKGTCRLLSSQCDAHVSVV